MFFKSLYLFFFGYVHILIEGFFIERFINICMNDNIILQDLHREKGTILKAKILKSDFKKIKKVAKKTKCRVHIKKKVGLPFFINRYRKRKSFAIALVVIAIFIFTTTRFIWNIEIVGNKNVTKEEILLSVKEYGIEVGKMKKDFDFQKITNEIRLKRSDISWIGIKIKGTNLIVEIVEAEEKPEIVDENKITNIVSNKKAIISKIVVQNGTVRINVGDEVKENDLLVEGVMEGKYTGNRFVHAEATILGKIYYEKEKKETFIQELEEKTGNTEKKREIYINNFKINFNKGVSNFENYDTIRTSKKLKLFSNFYIPIEIVTIENFEWKKTYKQFTEEELKDKLEKSLTNALEEEYKISEYPSDMVEKEVVVENEIDGLRVKVIYAVQEEIGKTQEVVF